METGNSSVIIKSKFLFSLFVLSAFMKIPDFAKTSEDQSYQIKNFSIQMQTNSNPADVYYPSLDSDTGYPVAVLLQAANVDKDQYSNFATQVASSGFIVIVPNTEFRIGIRLGLYPEAAVVNDAFQQVLNESNRSFSPLFHKADQSRLALIAHSFGGVVGLYAIDGSKHTFPFCRREYHKPPQLKAAVLFNTKKNLGPVDLSFETKRIPIAFITGDQDEKALLTDVKSTFQSISNPKALFTIEGANHFIITNDQNSTWKILNPGKSTIEQKAAIAKAAKWTSQFLRVFVNADINGFTELLDKNGTTEDGVQIQFELDN